MIEHILLKESQCLWFEKHWGAVIYSFFKLASLTLTICGLVQVSGPPEGAPLG